MASAYLELQELRDRLPDRTRQVKLYEKGAEISICPSFEDSPVVDISLPTRQLGKTIQLLGSLARAAEKYTVIPPGDKSLE